MTFAECRCPIHPSMSFDEIVSELNLFSGKSKNCCEDAGYICPSLDRELRRADVERQRRYQYNKRLKKAGYSQEAIANMKPRRNIHDKVIIKKGR